MLAKNNIFNIRATKGTTWKGQTGQRKGFVEFETREMAIRAWLVLMRTYRRRYAATTIGEIVTRFAPPSENDTRLYVEQMVAWTLIPENMELTQTWHYALLAVAMARKETGVAIFAGDVLMAMERYDIKIV